MSEALKKLNSENENAKLLDRIETILVVDVDSAISDVKDHFDPLSLSATNQDKDYARKRINEAYEKLQEAMCLIIKLMGKEPIEDFLGKWSKK